MPSSLISTAQGLAQRYREKRELIREIKAMKKTVDQCRKIGHLEVVIRHLHADPVTPKREAHSRVERNALPITTNTTTTTIDADKMSVISRVDSVMDDDPSPTTHIDIMSTISIPTSTPLTPQCVAINDVFSYLVMASVFRISEDGIEVLQALQSCILSVVETREWSESLSGEFDLEVVRSALEILATAARWKGEDEREGSGLQVWFEELEDAARYGVEVLDDEEEYEEDEGVGRVDSGVFKFAQKVLKLQL
ncbi:hypothetical protein N0V94_007977 [Neodidymelliopsis sp. IMI 364377]|nr:hypothetical protein N0V94_007977 [Neodidymelliopsis sp. IMI 364377]